MNNKKNHWIQLLHHLKNYTDLGGCYPSHPTALADDILLDLHNSSDDTQPRSVRVNYLFKA